MRAYTLFHVIFGAFVTVHAHFYFNTSTPYQCEALNVSWTGKWVPLRHIDTTDQYLGGGQAPFSLTIVPVYGNQTTFNLSDVYSNNGVGSFNFNLSLPEEQQFVLIMSDGTGFATGGVSSLMTVGPPHPAAETCDTSGQFFADIDVFYADTLKECQSYFFAFSNASQSTMIYGVVPAGTYIALYPPNGTSEFTWTSANVVAGTSMIFFMTDPEGRSSVVSPLLVSQSSGNTKCINSNSPSTTTFIAPSSHSSTVSSTSATTHATTTPVPKFTKLSIGLISVMAVGGTIFLVGFVALVLRCRRRNRKTPTFARVAPHFDIDGGFHELPELLHNGEPFPPPNPVPSVSSHDSIRLTSSSSHVTHLSPSGDRYTVAASALASLAPMALPRSRRSNIATAPTDSPYNNSSRAIIHGDVGDGIREAEHELVGLPPPAYDTSRRPLIFSDTRPSYEPLLS